MNAVNLLNARADGLASMASQCGFQVLDRHGSYIEVEFIGIVDQTCLREFCAAFQRYAVRDCVIVENQSDLQNKQTENQNNEIR